MIFDSIEAFRASGFAPRIGIIGAGPAGISIAHKLGKADIPTVIFEAGGNDYSDESQDFYKGKVIGDRLFRSRRHPAALSRRQLQPLGRLVPHPRGA